MKLQPIREELINNYPNSNNLTRMDINLSKNIKRIRKCLDLSNNSIDFKINALYGIKLDVFRCFFIFLMFFHRFISFLS